MENGKVNAMKSVLTGGSGNKGTRPQRAGKSAAFGLIARTWAILAAFVGLAYAANELTINTSLVYSKDGVSVQSAKSYAVTVSGTPVASGNVAISTNGTVVSMGTVADAGFAILINTTTNSWSEISYGAATNSVPFKLKGGESAIVRFATNTFGAVATTNAPSLYYIILSN